MNMDLIFEQNRLCFMTLVETTQEARDARLLLNSIRTFGGQLSNTPFWIFFQPGPLSGAISEILADVEGKQFIPLSLDPADPCGDFPFASKVHACAQAEALVGAPVRSLVWFNPGCLVVNTPSHFNLAPYFDAAFRPVHQQNIGSPAQLPLDDFWRTLFRSVGLDEAPFTIISFADTQALRPYFNTHCFSINPALGILNAWHQCFQALIDDTSFQSGPCRDPLHRIFLHQAVLSALIAKNLGREHIRILPQEYSYPLHMHPQISPDRRPRCLNDLVCPVYEGAFEYPATLNGLQVNEPVRAWLQGYGN